jgi:hypothetical protein
MNTNKEELLVYFKNYLNSNGNVEQWQIIDSLLKSANDLTVIKQAAQQSLSEFIADQKFIPKDSLRKLEPRGIFLFQYSKNTPVLSIEEMSAIEKEIDAVSCFFNNIHSFRDIIHEKCGNSLDNTIKTSLSRSPWYDFLNRFLDWLFNRPNTIVHLIIDQTEQPSTVLSNQFQRLQRLKGQNIQDIVENPRAQHHSQKNEVDLWTREQKSALSSLLNATDFTLVLDRIAKLDQQQKIEKTDITGLESLIQKHTECFTLLYNFYHDDLTKQQELAIVNLIKTIFPEKNKDIIKICIDGWTPSSHFDKTLERISKRVVPPAKKRNPWD